MWYGGWPGNDAAEGVMTLPVFPNDALCPYLLGSGYPLNAP